MASTTPQVSVLVPTYNRRRLLLETLTSILNQSYTDLEVIVVDNCSTDDTTAAVAAITDPRLIYVRNEVNVGPVNNHNRALRLAKGKYLCIFSDDDVMLEHNLARKVEVLEQNPSVGLVHSDMNTIDGEGQPIGGHWVSWYPSLRKTYAMLLEKPIMKQATAFDLLYNQRNFISMPTVLVRADLIRQNRLELNNQLHLLYDWDLWLKVALKTDFYYLNEVLVLYRLHASNDSQNFNPQVYYRELMLAKLGALNLFNKYDLHGRDYVAEVSASTREQLKAFELGETYAQEKIRLFKRFLKKTLPKSAVEQLKKKR